MTTAQWEVPPRKRKILFGEMLVFAILSLIAAAVLSIEAITLAKNPDAVLPIDEIGEALVEAAPMPS